MPVWLARCLGSITAIAVAGAILLAAPRAASATPSVHITGAVSSQAGGGVQNVSVTATAPGGTTTLFGPVLTASNGAYQLDVDPGTYDIHFTPQAGSGLNPIVSTNFAANIDRSSTSSSLRRRTRFLVWCVMVRVWCCRR